ncbi:hypothetical protein [Cerasicoccus frondis]|uniref:hypothetical protein n=1 Tax=Cerasicoccus frondis TaxID=490090 RepID=UPI0028528632|nr:hypothetical protein [Cerasicoccus frondis]
MLLSGCEYRETAPTAQAPVSGESFRDSAKAARIVERQEAGRTSAPGGGTSMAPLYGDNVYFVIEPIEFDELQPGMLVAYDSINGQRIVHQLVSKEGDYWSVKGINNPHEDSDYVTRQNLIGVVYGAFHAED